MSTLRTVALARLGFRFCNSEWGILPHVGVGGVKRSYFRAKGSLHLSFPVQRGEEDHPSG